jgi:hypothetical protein
MKCFSIPAYEGATMLPATVADVHRKGIKIVPESCPERNQEDRIIEALGPLELHLPGVDEETLSRYYTYLTARLSFPFTAYYPEPTVTLEEVRHRCTVVELLDPAHDICDEFDGIFCKTRKGKYEINLPLTELRVSENSPNFQLIEDYWYWFWNWR